MDTRRFRGEDREDSGRAAGRSRPARRASARVEALEGRALLSGMVNDVTTLPAGLKAGPMAVASDGSLWYAQVGGDKGVSLGRVTASGQKTEVAIPSATAGGTIDGLTADPAGNVWYTYSPPASSPDALAVVGRVERSGDVKEYAMATAADRVDGTTVGPDGQVWVALEPASSGGLTAGGPALAKVAADGALTRIPVTGATEIKWLTAAADGNLWFVDGQRIGKASPDGAVSFYTLTPPADGAAIDLSNAQLTPGPDGNIWFIGLGGLSKITPTGTVSTIASPQAKITSLGTASDGKIWFSFLPPAGTDLARNSPGPVLARMSPDGAVTVLDDRADANPVAVVRMAAGKDAGLWLSEGDGEFSRVNLASTPNFSPPIVRPTTAGTLTAVQGQPLAGVVATFVPNRADTEGLAYKSTIDWGDGKVTPATVKADGKGGFIVEGSNTYTTTPGQTLQVKINLVDPSGGTAIIFNQVTVQAPPTAMMAVPPRWRSFPAGSLKAKAALAALAAVNAETPAGTTAPVPGTPAPANTTPATPTTTPATTPASTTASTPVVSTTPATGSGATTTSLTLSDSSATGNASTTPTTGSGVTTTATPASGTTTAATPNTGASSTTTVRTATTTVTTTSSTTGARPVMPGAGVAGRLARTPYAAAAAARARQAAQKARGGIHAQIVQTGTGAYPRGPMAHAHARVARPARVWRA